MDADLKMVIITMGLQVHPDIKVRQEFMQKYQLDDLFYPEDRFVNFAKGHGIPTLALARKFQKTAEQENVYFHGFENTRMGEGHYNQNAHTLMANMLTDFYCKSLPVPEQNVNWSSFNSLPSVGCNTIPGTAGFFTL